MMKKNEDEDLPSYTEALLWKLNWENLQKLVKKVLNVILKEIDIS